MSGESVSRWYRYLHDASVNNRRVRYLDVGEGPVLLLIHGIGCNWMHWAANLDELSRDHRVIAVDLPGFGASEALDAGLELGATADAVVGLLDVIGVDEFSVAGHSLGGLVAWLVASAARQRVQHLCIVDGAVVSLSALELGAIVRSFTVMGKLFANPAVARAVLYRPRLRNLLLAIFFADTSQITSAEMAVGLLTPFTAAPGFFEALWSAPRANQLLKPSEMDVPTLICWGTMDTIFFVRAARVLAAEMPDAELLEFRGARHWPMLEQPAKFDAALLEFLARDHTVPGQETTPASI